MKTVPEKFGSVYISPLKGITCAWNLIFCCRHAAGFQHPECAPFGDEAPAGVELATPVQAQYRGG
jgi:hypothetical protein